MDALPFFGDPMPRSTPLVCLIALAAAVSCPRSASAQTTAAAQTPPVPTLHARTKLVVIDVVITDKDHRAVHNLRQEDFTLLESGEPQTVKSFEEHRPNPSAAIVSPPSMPPGFFTNLTPVSNDAPVNILLIDTLNTALTDQTFVRDQMLKYLKSSRPNSNMAVFGLSTRLLMLQGFTTNPELLRAAINRQNGNPSPLMPDAVGAGLTSDELSAQLAGAGAPAGMIANLESFESDTNPYNGFPVLSHSTSFLKVEMEPAAFPPATRSPASINPKANTARPQTFSPAVE
jgi:hypothetical protein